MIECSKVKWRLVAWVAAAMAGVGLCVAMALLVAFSRVIAAHMRPEIFLIAAGCGAALAGAATHPLFGRPSWRGWALALAGALLATGLGAGLAGLATLPLDQFDLVATAVAMTLMTPMGAPWLALMALVHLLAGRARG